uniref:putative F-box protein At1g53360 n=1 Tax=Fragaria vesca subsp. vesca TaxID=101020 RepID=UPI0005CB70A6|nr:PREDICTED: putative F-box protein At1g53360 [Fragaria vesca subsp. vesca]
MGFDSITNTYKILCVAWIRVPNSPITERWCYVSLMLVLGTSEWRRLPSSLPCLAHFKPSKGICAHGDMHWLVSSRREGIRGHAHILSFDFKKEEFCWIPNPYRLPDMNRGLHLIMLRGSMAVVDTTSEQSEDLGPSNC